jgi:hypothetical protein
MKSKQHLFWLAGLLVISLMLSLTGLGTAQTDSLPEEAYISGLGGHAQSYSLSCESRSAVDWAAFWGLSIDEAEFQTNLPRSDNPDKGFGVHAGPVAALLRHYGLQATAHRDLSWDDLRVEIAAGRPVIVWIIGQMWYGTPRTYKAPDGTSTVVAQFEHTMILTGYDSTSVQVVDAYSGWTLTYPLTNFLASWSVLGDMAILGQGLAPSTTPEPSQPRDASGESAVILYFPIVNSTGPRAPAAQATVTASKPEPKPETYIVKRGDYLKALGDHFGVDWQDLAALNQIIFPYIIYPGQVLRIR